MSHNNGRSKWVMRWLLALTIILIAGAIAAPIIGGAIIEANTTKTELAVTCTSARANISQLKALRSFSHQIGVPWIYPIPEVPAECNGR